MNTNTPLHDVLEEHAHDIHGIEPGDRLGQVHGRIRGVRRRRRTGVAAVAAAAVAVVGVVTLFPRDPEPAPTDRDLAGHTAPKSMDSLGFSYEFAEAFEGDRLVQVTLPESDQPRLVTWAGSGGPLRLQSTRPLDGDGNGPYLITSTAADFSDFQYIAPNESVDLKVTSDDGQVAVAVYDLDAWPEAVAKDGYFYRNDVAGSRLLASSIGDPGQSAVTVQFTMPETALRTSEFCDGVSDDYLVWVEVAGGPVSGVPCAQSTPFDPGATGTSQDTWWESEGDRIEPGEVVTARVWVDKGQRAVPDDTTPDDVPGVRLGLGIYAEPEPAATVGGWDLPPRYEHDGRLYEHVYSATTEPGSGEISVEATADDGPVLVLGFSTARDTMEIFADDQSVGYLFDNGGHTRLIGVVPEGTTVYRIAGGSAIGPKAIVGLAKYELVD